MCVFVWGEIKKKSNEKETVIEKKSLAERKMREKEKEGERARRRYDTIQELKDIYLFLADTSSNMLHT